MKYIVNLVLLVFLLACTESVGQSVRLFEHQDTVWYSMDKKAAQNVLYKANKGVYLDQYVSQQKVLLDQVIQAKVKSDSIQIVLQNEMAKYNQYLIECSQDKVKLINESAGMLEKNRKLKRQRNIAAGMTFVAAIILGISL